MRTWLVAAAAALMLAACGQNGPDGSGGSGGGGVSLSDVFPDLNAASYRAEGVIHQPGGSSTTPFVQIRSGKLMRTEYTDATSGVQSAMVINGETQEAFSITQVAGRTMVMRMDMSEMQARMPGSGVNVGQNAPTRVGGCSAAGESGAEWSITTEGHTQLMCVSGDGVMLRTTLDGQVMTEVTSVQRGPQDPALFTIPAGAQVTDMGAIAAGMQGQLQQLREKMGQ